MKGRPLKVPESFEHEDFTKLYHQSQHPREKIRYLALSLLQQGKQTATEIAALLQVSRMSLVRWLQAYRQHGVDGLKERPRRGRESLLSSQQASTLGPLVQKLAKECVGGRVMGKHVQQALSEQGIICSLASVYAWLHKAGLSWVSSRSRHPQSDPEAQREFKKNFPLLVQEAVGDKANGKRLLVWFQDEARVGQQGTTTRLWAPRGTRPAALKQQGFESAYVFGSVCPSKGVCEGIVMPRANSEAMNKHLALLSSNLESDEHAVVVCDRASWHRSKSLCVPSNITLLHLPPYSPELNPAEQVWQWMRQRFWSNRVFTGYEDIVLACCQAWNAFADAPGQVASLCTRKWALI